MIINIASNVNGIDTMAVIMYNAVREFMSRRYPKKGKKGMGNKNRIPIPIYVDSQKIFLAYSHQSIKVCSLW